MAKEGCRIALDHVKAASLFKGDVKRALKALPYRTPSFLKGCYRIAKIEEHAIRRQSLAQR
jgi:hypothetical protein